MRDIIEFIEDPRLINDQTLSLAQRVILKATYGLPLDTQELEIFLGLTELPRYREGVESSEITALLPRRSGKSSRLAANIMIYEACGREIEASGSQPCCLITASEKSRQARIIFRYVKDKLQRSKLLSAMIANITREEILLVNGVSIQIFPADPDRVRGQSYLFFCADEVAVWRSEGVHMDSDVLDAARPGLEYANSKLLKISTPGGKFGEIWEDYKEFFAKENDHVLVFSSGNHDTKFFNPTYSQRKLDKMKERKPSLFEAEHLARFRDTRGLFSHDLIDGLVNRQRPLELPPQKGIKYLGFSDNAGGGAKSSYAICIGHVESNRVIIDVCRSQAQPFDPDSQTKIYCDLFRSYGITQVQGDYYAAEWNVQAHRKYGVYYMKCEKAKSELFLESESLFACGLIELPPLDSLEHQLKMLVRTPRAGSKDRVDVPARQPDDEANCVCGVTWMADVSLHEPRLVESRGISEEIGDTEAGKSEKAFCDSLLVPSTKPMSKKKPDQIDMAALERELDLPSLEDEFKYSKENGWEDVPDDE